MKFLHAFNDYNPMVIPLYKIKGIVERGYCFIEDDGGHKHPAVVITAELYDGKISITPFVQKSECDGQVYISELMKMVKRAPEWSTICCYRGDEIDLFVEVI
jgi:hypothetical protein